MPRSAVSVTMGLVFAGLILSSPGRADSLEINVEQIKVYDSPDEEADVIFILFKGDAVPVSRKSPAGYKKVLIQDGGEKRVGYLKNSDLTQGVKTNTQIQKKSKKPKGSYLQGHTVLGLLGGGTYQNQGARTYTDSTGTQTSISALSGFSTFFGIFLDYPFAERFSLEAYAQYKRVSVTGTATYSLALVPNSATDTFLKQNFLVAGLLGKFYPGYRSSWWFGGGLQMDKALSGTLKFGAFPETPLEGKDLPTFTYVYGAIGAYFPLFGGFYLMPDLRAGVLLISSPLILEADIIGNIGYAF